MYDIYLFIGSEQEFMGSTDSLYRAGLSAQSWSLDDGVSEVLIYDDGVLVEVWVDGNTIDLKEYMEKDLEEFDDDDYLYDEVGYNPYTGGYDCDL